MFEPMSRYAEIETTTLRTPDGRLLPYKRRRFLPKVGDVTGMIEITVTQGDRLDLIASRTLGNPEQFWQICDANPTESMSPFDLTMEVGRVLRVPLPGVWRKS